MTLFKGLLSSEDHISPPELTGTELGGGFCTFSTTFAIPPSVINGALQKLKQREHSTPQRLGPFFNFRTGDPEPTLGIVPITNSSVVCAVQDPNVVGRQILMAAQYSGKGSIEAQGICSFLISCNMLAAGEIASTLKAGGSPPFMVSNTLQETFYINGVTVDVDVDVDKVYDSFSAAVSAGGLFKINSINAEFAYQSCVTSGAITTHMTQNQAVLDDATKKWVTESVDLMKKTAIDLVKQEIFDFDPSKTDTKATADRGWVSELFGGAAVSLKSTHARRGVHLRQRLILDQTVAVSHTVSGDLNELLPAVRADLNKYLFVIDIGEFFKKVQVAGYSEVNFRPPSDTEPSDPLRAVQLEVGYPDFSRPVENGQVNLVTRTSGRHYVNGEAGPSGQDRPAIWDARTAEDFVNISFLRLDNPVDGWPSDQVKLRRKLIFDGHDPRVNLSPKIAPRDRAVAELEELTSDHAPAMTASAVGYVFVRFVLRTQLPPNITVQITPTIGEDTYPAVVITRDTMKNALWEVYSDKYFDATEFRYAITVTVDGPEFTDDPVVYSSPEPVRVAVVKGMLTRLEHLDVTLPPVPADKKETVNRYVAAARQAHV
jgi:hypothetical protein